MQRSGENPLDGVEGHHPLPAVHLGNLGLYLTLIPLAETSEYRQLADIALLFGPGRLQNRAYGFLLGVIDEPAGIDDNFVHPAGRQVGILRHKLISPALQHRHQTFGIHKILGATERYDLYPFQILFVFLFLLFLNELQRAEFGQAVVPVQNLLHMGDVETVFIVCGQHRSEEFLYLVRIAL